MQDILIEALGAGVVLESVLHAELDRNRALLASKVEIVVGVRALHAVVAGSAQRARVRLVLRVDPAVRGQRGVLRAQAALPVHVEGLEAQRALVGAIELVAVFDDLVLKSPVRHRVRQAGGVRRLVVPLPAAPARLRARVAIAEIDLLVSLAEGRVEDGVAHPGLHAQLDGHHLPEELAYVVR